MVSVARVSQTIRRFIDPVIGRIRFNRTLHRNSSNQNKSAAIERQLKAHTPIFVFQMGKVGSTSIFQSLIDSGIPNPIFHAHTFEAYHSSLEIRTLFDYYHRFAPPLKIITLVREPVTRNISAFFQNFKRDTGSDIDDCRHSPAKLKSLFLKNYPHEIPLIWFDVNIQKHFGIDVYDYPFPDCGHLRIKQQGVDLLIMRHDIDNSVKQSLIATHVGCSNFQLVDQNIGADKRYADRYAQFKRMKLPLEHLYYLASSQYMHHFFANDMREIIQSWTDQEIV